MGKRKKRFCAVKEQRDRHRALVVTPAKKAYYCFASRKGGDVIALVAHVKGMSVKDTTLAIAEYTGTVPVQESGNGTSTRNSTNTDTDAKTVTLAVGPIFAARWLIPRLNRFRRRHPDIELVLQHGPRITGVENINADMAVDWGEGYWEGLVSTRLLDVHYLPALSPLLAKESGGLSKPSDLARFTILHNTDRSEWNDWLQLADIPDLKFADEAVIVDSNVILQAALDGQGVALGTFPFVQAEVDNGRLICPLNISLKPSRSYYLLTRPAGRKQMEIATVYDWLIREARASSKVPVK